MSEPQQTEERKRTIRREGARGRRGTVAVPRPPTCAMEALHTPTGLHPSDYLGWHAWAERKSKTHIQQQCPGCGLWAVWKPKPKEPK